MINVSSWSIRNPTPAILLFVLLTLIGVMGFRGMKIQQFPDIDLPTVTITAALPGASPAQMETDVARKLIILGRELGLGLELADVKVESLVPNGLERGTIDEFMQRLPASDAAMQARFAAAKARGKVLRYVGRLTAEGEATVGVVEVEGRHAFANIALTDNIVRFATARYSANPLIVQGPGAGPEVTAGGVFADLLRLSAYLGARL